MKLAPKRELNSRLSPGNGECEFPAWRFRICGPWLGELKSRRSGSIRRSRGAVAERISRDAKRSPRLELGGECGASKPKPLHGHFVQSATLRPERRGCGRQGGRPHRSRQAGWSPTTRESESAASAMGAQRHRGRRSLARAQSLHGECRRRSVFRVGKVISPTEGRFRILDFLQARSARPAFREAREALARHPPSAGKKSGSFQTRIRGRIAHPAGVDF